MLELTADGTNYLAGAAPAAENAALEATWDNSWLVLQSILDGVKLTRRQIAQAWRDKPVPSDATLWRWLTSAVESGLLEQQGSGNRGDPRRYWLRGQTATWTPDYAEILGL